MLVVLYQIFLVPITTLTLRAIIIKMQSSWVATAGEVLNYKIKSRKYPNKLTEFGESFIAYWLQAKYCFVVNNKEYTSTRVSLDIMNEIYTDEDLKTDAFLQSLKSKTITVYYFKYWPRLCVMTMPHNKGLDHLVVIFALAMILLIVTVLVKIAYPEIA